jgi:hypothetical protein
MVHSRKILFEQEQNKLKKGSKEDFYEAVRRLHSFEESSFYKEDLASVIYYWIFFISLFFKVDKVAPAIGLFPLSQFKITCTIMKTPLIYYAYLALVPLQAGQKLLSAVIEVSNDHST